jgi:hypothetical protein
MRNFMAANESEIANLKMNLQLFAEGDGVEPTTEPVTEPTAEPTTEPTTEPVTEPTTEPIKEPTETQAFSKRLNEMTQKAIDAEYDRLYGTEYGIHSKADYDAYIAKQQEEAEKQQFQEQYGIDPTVIDERVQKLLESHPAVVAAKEQSNKMIFDSAAIELASVAKSIGIEQEIKSWADVEKLPKYAEIKANILKGNDVISAAKLAYFDDVVGKTAQTAQQEAIKKIAANGASSPGSLSAGGESDFISQELFESKKSDQRWVIKNLSKIQKSRANW